jgi:hypothetical protein
MNILQIYKIVNTALPIVTWTVYVFLAFAILNMAMVIFYGHKKYLVYSIFTFAISIALTVAIIYANKYYKIFKNILVQIQDNLKQIQTLLQGKVEDVKSVMAQIQSALSKTKDLPQDVLNQIQNILQTSLGGYQNIISQVMNYVAEIVGFFQQLNT